MYLSVYLFKDKPTGPHEVDFIIGNRMDYNYKISCPKKRGGGGGVVIIERGLFTKTDFQTFTFNSVRQTYP